MQAEYEFGDDAEVSTAAAQAPKQLRLLICACRDDLSIRQADFCRQQAVDRQTETAAEPTHAAAQCKARNSRMGDDTCRRDEPEGVGRPVEIAEQRTTFDFGNP